MYHTTIDEFKKKLYEQKQETVLARVNNQYKDTRDVPTHGINGNASATKLA